VDIFLEFLGETILDFAKNVFPPLEPKLSVMWEGIGEALLNVCKVLHTV
jgi:hypothetical protein